MVKVSTTVPKETHKQLTRLAQQNGRTIGRIVRAGIDLALEAASDVPAWVESLPKDGRRNGAEAQ